MARNAEIATALAAWRDAERRLLGAATADEATLSLEAARCRDAFQRLSTENMAVWMQKLSEAERRRAGATPSTPAFHEAARDTQDIAAGIWEAARSSDEDTPHSEHAEKRNSTPNPTEGDGARGRVLAKTLRRSR